MYFDKVFSKFHLDKAYIVNTLIKKSAILKQKTDKEISAFKKKWYYGITSSLMFLMVETRPDIVFATSIASRFATNL